MSTHSPRVNTRDADLWLGRHSVSQFQIWVHICTSTSSPSLLRPLLHLSTWMLSHAPAILLGLSCYGGGGNNVKTRWCLSVSLALLQESSLTAAAAESGVGQTIKTGTVKTFLLLIWAALQRQSRAAEFKGRVQVGREEGQQGAGKTESTRAHRCRHSDGGKDEGRMQSLMREF